METSTKTTVMLKAIDMELKTLLLQDLERIKSEHTKQAPVKQAA